MPGGRPKGLPKTGGRVKGSKSKHLSSISEKLKAWDCDPFEVLAKIADNKLPCSVCRGAGRTKFQPGGGSERFSGERTCQSCWGSKMERISPKERGWAAGELASYIAPKRKAIEVTGEDGGAIEHDHRLVFVGGSDAPVNGHRVS